MEYGALWMDNSIHKIGIILLGIFIQIGVTTGQSYYTDSLGLYSNGRVEFNWDSMKRHKLYNGKTFLLQEKYSNGTIHKECFRNNDSTFLYTEFHKEPDTTITYKGETWGIMREGLMVVSNQTTGDTIIQFDPDTYEAVIHTDTLLLPFKKWTYYYPNGNKKAEGEFVHYKQNGWWTYYNEFRGITKKIKYLSGAIKEVQTINKVEEQSLEMTQDFLLDEWIIPEPEMNGYKPNPGLEAFKFMYKNSSRNRAGEIFRFIENGTLEYTKTKVVSSEYKEGPNGLVIIPLTKTLQETSGTWKLIDYKTIEVNINNRIETYQIQYLSEFALTLKK